MARITFSSQQLWKYEKPLDGSKSVAGRESIDSDLQWDDDRLKQAREEEEG